MTIPQHLYPATNPLIYSNNLTLGPTSAPILAPSLVTSDGIAVSSRDSALINDITETPRGRKRKANDSATEQKIQALTEGREIQKRKEEREIELHETIIQYYRTKQQGEREMRFREEERQKELHQMKMNYYRKKMQTVFK